ncbi:MAG TPA: dTDP-4-dehydrorhamnose reductase [Bacteroidota bacterium]|nr:dTDP-4-dehydrorhamnose reductase [Bacteroidota bacterium]
MKIAIIGADGQLGTDLVEACTRAGHSVFPLTYEDIHIEDIDSVSRALTPIHPDAVFNAAAFHNVPKCETEIDQAFAVNAKGPLILATLSESLGYALVHYSTDYVFDGIKHSPYLETDAPNPLNIYATSKLAGEYCALNYARRGTVIRLSGIYGRVPSLMKGNNFVSIMVKLASEKPEVRVVTDEVLSPTPTSEIAERSLFILNSGRTGLYHLVSEGECSWYEFAEVIWQTLGLTTPLLKTSVKEFASPVKRPFYSALENARYNALPGSVPMTHWKEALIKFLHTHYLLKGTP